MQKNFTPFKSTANRARIYPVIVGTLIFIMLLLTKSVSAQTPGSIGISQTSANICVNGEVTFTSRYNGSGSTRSDVVQWYFKSTTSSTYTPINAAPNKFIITSTTPSPNDRETTLTIKGLATDESGSYFVVFNPNRGASRAAILTVNPLPVATISASGPTSFCQGGSVTLTASPGSSYLWSNGATTQSILVSASGNYTVTVTNANTCSATSAATSVTVNPLPTATITAIGSTTFCEGGSVKLSASPGASYLWNNGATTREIDVTTSGNYVVTVTNANGCSATSAATSVTVNPLPTTPTISANGPTTFCQGGSVTLTASAIGNGSSYLWSNGATTQAIIVNTSGDYTVTVKNSNNCSATSAATSVIVNPLPTATITAGGETTFCEGGSVTLTANDAGDGSSYLWSNGATTREIDVTVSGNYSVTVRNSNNCSATSAPISVTVKPLPTAAITTSGPTTFCEGGSVTLTASDGASYLWSNGAITKSITVNASGNYSVQVNGANGCSASAATSVNVYPLPTATISVNGPTTICPSSSVLLTGNSNHQNVIYTWFKDGVEQATGATYSATTTGSYTVVATDANTCSSEVSAPVTVTVITENNIIREGATTSFCAGTSTILHALTGENFGYVWTKNGSPLAETGPNLTVTEAGSYNVTLTTPGCITVSTTTQVTANPLPTAAITPNGPTTFCEGGSVTLTASVGASYLWSNGATTQAITVDTPGDYTVTVTNANECSATSAVTSVIVNPLPATPTISASGPTTFCQGGSVTLTASEGSAYLWSNGATTQSINVTSSNNYTVQVTNANGCISANSAAISVVVNSLPEATITPSRSTTLCQGESVMLTASGGSSWLWSNGATTQAITVDTPGDYTVTVTNANECSATSAVTSVIVNPLPATPTISASGPTTFCQGGSVTLTASEGSAYLWSNGATTQSINVTTSGNYRVTVTNANSCSATSAITSIIVNPLPATPTISANGPTTFCQGGSVTLTASEGSAYLWSTGATTRSITVSTTGNYTVQVSNANGCFTSSNATTVTATKPDTYTLILTTVPFPVCGRADYTAHVIKNVTSVNYPANENIRIQPVTWVGGQDVTNQFTFDWLKNDDINRRNGNTGPTIGESGLRSEEYYTVRARPKSSISCVVWDNRSDLVPTNNPEGNVLFSNRIYLGTPMNYGVTITANPSDPICSGTSVTFTANFITPANGGTQPAYVNPVYQWFVNNQPVQGQGATFTSSTLVNGDKISVTIDSDDNGCDAVASTNTITMTVYSPPAITSTGQPQATAACVGQPANFSVQATGTNLTFAWFRVGEPNSISAGNSINNNGVITNTLTLNNVQLADNNSQYYVVVSGTCSPSAQSNTVTLTVNSLPTAPGVSPVTYCQNATATALTASGTNLKWYNSLDPNATPLPGAPTPLTNSVGTTSYYVSQTNTNGCEGPRAEVQVTITQPISWAIELSSDPEFGEIVMGEEVTYTASAFITDPVTGNKTPLLKANYRWEVYFSNVDVPNDDDDFDVKQNGQSNTFTMITPAPENDQEVYIMNVRVFVTPNPTDYCTEQITRTAESGDRQPLPVELLYLKATKQNNNVVELEWATAMEQNSEGFEVQVSQDAKNYRTLAFVASKAGGNTNEKQVYTFHDKENGKYGTRYYRLMQRDMNGDAEYFGPKAVQIGEATESLTAYPNPFQQEVTLDINAEEAGSMHVLVTNAIGAKVMERTLKIEKGNNKQTLQFNSNLPQGMYNITTRQSGKVQHFKLLKQQ